MTRRQAGWPSVSVALATFNGERYLQEQLESLAGQTQLPDELVVSDDGSTDSTLAILGEFARRAPFPVDIAVNPVRLGYTRNFVATARRCRGEMLFFCDQDDIWMTEKLRVVCEIAAASPQAVISHDISVFSDEASLPSLPSYFDYLDQAGFARAVCLKGCAMAVKAGFIRRWGWPDEDSGVSYDVWIGLLSTAFRQRHYCGVPLVRHRLHRGNASGWIVTDADRTRSIRWPSWRRREQSDVDLLVELIIKSRNRGWADTFISAVQLHGADLDPALATALIGDLDDNRRNHTLLRRWLRF